MLLRLRKLIGRLLLIGWCGRFLLICWFCGKCLLGGLWYDGVCWYWLVDFVG